MNPIDSLFRRLRAQGRKACIPFLTAGDPDPAATPYIAAAVVEAGADLVEIGFPYSDPIADGPVIQASYTRVLERGFRLGDAFDCVRRVADLPVVRERGVPLVAMVSYSIIHRRGPEAFLRQAAQAGLSGAIVPDLPVDESQGLCELAAARDFKLVHLVTPTTPRERALEIARRSTGFLYCVSVTGITGERQTLPLELREQLGWLRTQTELPLCVGFGISTPEHVRMLRDSADGIIVGSALVRRLEQVGPTPLVDVLGDIRSLVRGLVAALHEPR
jgi:tryptophan synthase alpha chain